MLNLKGKNLVAELESVAEISYTFTKSRMFVEPLMLIACFFVFFAMSMIVSRMGTLGGKSEKEEKKD